jgi:hypothetical protein
MSMCEVEGVQIKRAAKQRPSKETRVHESPSKRSWSYRLSQALSLPPEEGAAIYRGL